MRHADSNEIPLEHYNEEHMKNTLVSSLQGVATDCCSEFSDI